MKGVAPRRHQQRQSAKQGTTQGSDAPVSVVFRAHTDSLSRAQFLFCPKNFNLTNPTPSSSNTAEAAGGPAARRAAAPHAHRTASSASGGNGGAAAGAASSSGAVLGEDVSHLVEAIIELRPSFPASTLPPPQHASSGSGGAGGDDGGTHRAAASSNLNGGVAGSFALSGGAHGPHGTGCVLERGMAESTGSFAHAGALPRGLPSSAQLFGLGSHVDLFAFSTSFATAATPTSTAATAVSSASFGRALEKDRTAVVLSGGSVAGLTSVSSSSGAPVAAATPSMMADAGGVGGSGPDGSGLASSSPASQLHPSGGWICRAMAFNEKETNHANGAISVNQCLTLKCPIVNEVAKGKTMARVISSYAEVRARYGLSHVELSFEHQFVSRSDLFLVSEALWERILYEGEEINMCGFRFKVKEMLQCVPTAGVAAATAATAAVGGGGGARGTNNGGADPAASLPASAAIPVSGSAGGGATGRVNTGPGGLASASPTHPEEGAGTTGGGGGAEKTAAGVAAAESATPPPRLIRVGCGVVTAQTRINYLSLSPMHYVIIELAREMWDTTIDGRISLTWALKKFMREFLLQQLPKRKASPLLRVVFTGRLRPELQVRGHTDLFHVLEIPREVRGVDVASEVEQHCEAFVQRVLGEVRAELQRQLQQEEDRILARGPSRQGMAGGRDAAFTSSPLAAEAATPTHAFYRTHNGLDEEDDDGDDDEGDSRDSEGGANTPLSLSPEHARLSAKLAQLTPKQLFVHAKQSNTLAALSILLEGNSHHYFDRRLDITGHAITIVSAGKGLYQTTNSLVQVTCARLHDIGLERVNIVCIGRPPLHRTPLLEYSADDETMRSQYHLYSELQTASSSAAEPQRVYESPEWVTTLFYHPRLDSNAAELPFELLTKEDWLRRHNPHVPMPLLTPLFNGNASSGAGSNVNYLQLTQTSISGGRGARELSQVPMEEVVFNSIGGGVSAAFFHGQSVLIPGLGLHEHPVQKVVFPVHPETNNDALETEQDDNGDDVLLSVRCRDPRASVSVVSQVDMPGLHTLPQLLPPPTHSMASGGGPAVAAAAGYGTSPANRSSGSAVSEGSYAAARQFLAHRSPGTFDHRRDRLTSSLVSQRIATAAAAAPVAVTPSSYSATRRVSRSVSHDVTTTGAGTPLYLSRSCDYKTTANPTCHLAGVFQQSLRSLPSMLAPNDAPGSISSTTRRPLRLGDHPATATATARQHAGGDGQLGNAARPNLPAATAMGGAVADEDEDDVFAQWARSRWGDGAGGAVREGGEEGALTQGRWRSLPFVHSMWYCLHGAKAAVAATAVNPATATSTTNTSSTLHATGAHPPPPPLGGGEAGSAASPPPGSPHTPPGGGQPTAGLEQAVTARDGSSGGGVAARETAAGSAWRRAPDDSAPSSAPTTAAELAAKVAKCQKPRSATRSDVTPCGDNIVDSELKIGYVILELTLSDDVLPGARWSPALLFDDAQWGALLNCFSGRDDRVGAGVDPRGERFQSDFRPGDVFCRTYSGITADGRTLILPTHHNSSAFQASEELRFTYQPFLIEPLRTSSPKARGAADGEEEEEGMHVIEDRQEPHPQPVLHSAAAATPQPRRPSPPSLRPPLPPGTSVTVGWVQLRNRLLFAIRPVHPLRGANEYTALAGGGGGGGGVGGVGAMDDNTGLAVSSENVSTALVFRRRWMYKHPDTSIASELPHVASWTRLCVCKLLPLYGSKSSYPRDGFYTVSPHQYTLADPSSGGDEKRRLLEFMLQRLQQQYQIVVEGGGVNAPFPVQWPRADPTPNARLEMSIGHQTHSLKVGETAQRLSITRMLHRGMYSNGQATHMLSYRYALWNYLDDVFAPREVHVEAQIGENSAFCWEALDRWLQQRPDAFIPRGPDVWLRAREVAVVLLPDDLSKPPAFDEFLRFIGYRFSIHLSTRGKVQWMPDTRDLAVDVPDSPREFPEAPPLMEVVLVHDNPHTLELRTLIDHTTGRTVAFEQPVEERLMSVDISLPQLYHPQCCYFLKVSWLVCAASIVVDWYGSFVANAARYHFRAIPIPCYHQNPKAEALLAHSDVVLSVAEEPEAREKLLLLLIKPPYLYFPDTPLLNRHCRLVHYSGLAYIIFPPSTNVVAQWYQNSAVRQGSVEQQMLLAEFKQAVQQVMREVRSENLVLRSG